MVRRKASCVMRMSMCPVDLLENMVSKAPGYLLPDTYRLVWQMPGSRSLVIPEQMAFIMVPRSSKQFHGGELTNRLRRGLTKLEHWVFFFFLERRRNM